MSKPKQPKCNPKNVKNTRCVLTTPKDSFWPVLEDDSPIITEFEKVLSSAKTVHPNLNWFKTRKLSKEERRANVKEFFANLPKDILESHNNAMKLRENLAIGVNDVSRALEETNLACCVISGNAKPKLLISHVIELAKVKGIPVLVVNVLKEKVMASLGHSSLAIGFKKEILENSNHHMYKLCRDIINLFNKRYHCVDEDRADVENFNTICASSLKIDSYMTKEECLGISDLRIDDIYLYRSSTTFRVFHPNEITDITIEDKIDIPTDKNENEPELEPLRKKQCYEPPNVKVIQNNPNKNRHNKNKRYFGISK